MRFNVPQFIEHEPKIAGPFTFKQFAYLIIAGVLCFIVYFSAPIAVFVLSLFFFGGLALALGFLKINGRGLPTLIVNFFKFFLSPKIFLWHKKEIPIEIFKTERRKETKKEESPLRISSGSKLKSLKNKLEVKNRQ